MPNTAKKIVIAALATGGIVAGVATASAAPLRTASPVAATSAEAAKLHAEVEALTGKEQALQTTLRARHLARPSTTGAPAGSAVTPAATTTGYGSEPAVPAPTTVPEPITGSPTVVPPTTVDDHHGSPTTEPTEPESGPTTTTVSSATTKPTWVEDGATHGTDG